MLMHVLARALFSKSKSMSRLFELVCSSKFLTHANGISSSRGIIASILKARLKGISPVRTLDVIWYWPKYMVKFIGPRALSLVQSLFDALESSVCHFCLSISLRVRHWGEVRRGDVRSHDFHRTRIWFWQIVVHYWWSTPGRSQIGILWPSMWINHLGLNNLGQRLGLYPLCEVVHSDYQELSLSQSKRKWIEISIPHYTKGKGAHMGVAGIVGKCWMFEFL